jgi:hypothetical protein
VRVGVWAAAESSNPPAALIDRMKVRRFIGFQSLYARRFLCVLEKDCLFALQDILRKESSVAAVPMVSRRRGTAFLCEFEMCPAFALIDSTAEYP